VPIDGPLPRYFPNTTKIMRIKRYAFRAEPLAGKSIFLIPSKKASPLFFLEDAVATFRKHKLTGVTFEPVWEG